MFSVSVSVILFLSLILIGVVVIVALFIIVKYIKLTLKYNSLIKYLYNYLNIITSLRYGNLNLKCEDGIDAFTIQLSRNTNALIESIKDRDMMIQEYIEKEKQTQSLKQDFISSLAHDLKVPIIAQDNTYDLFLNNAFGELDGIKRKAIENLKISNNDLKNLTLNLLEAHKIDTHKLELNIQNTDLNLLISEIIEQNKSILTIQNKVINYNENKNIIYPIDIFLFKRALNNLIANAIFHGKNTKNINIFLNKTQTQIELSIQDEGEGIKGDIESIFKKYYTSAKKYSNINQGLGLYIANKIILAHKGKIEAKNNENNKGACFTIILPLKN